jgi:hypothetical protein
LVEFINAATAIMLQTSLPAPEPLEKMSLSASKTGFVWVEPAPHLIAGDVQRFAELNGVKPAKTGGFWYSRPSKNPHGHKASPGEKVVYHLHGMFLENSGGHF